MKCEEVHHFMDTYLDGELDLGLQVELEQHLALCPSCRSLLEERRAFRAFFVAAVGGDKTSPQLEGKGLGAGGRGPTKEKISLWRQPWIYATAVAVMTVLLALKKLFPDTEREVSRQAVF